jgi:hypothetical protein
VEALHRGAENLIVFDASGDHTDTWSTLGGAVALARTDAGVEISLNPTTMIQEDGKVPALEPGQVLRPWASGSFVRPGAAPRPGNGADVERNGDGLAGRNGDGLAGRNGDGPAVRSAGMAGGPQAGVGEQAGALSQATGQHADRELPSAGEIWICKLGWWDQAPWDVRAYAAGHSTYPCDTTLQQFYDGAEFEAYHELGAAAVTAARAGGLPV